MLVIVHVFIRWDQCFLNGVLWNPRVLQSEQKGYSRNFHYNKKKWYNTETNYKWNVVSDLGIQLLNIKPNIKIVCEERMKIHSSHCKLQICGILHFKLHFSYTWNAIFLPKCV
jgi:hypothetical protein